jgi:hypothetical protein
MGLGDYTHHIAILQSALDSEYGITVGTPDPHAAKREFERARSLDSSFANLQIVWSRTNPNGEIWILK